MQNDLLDEAVREVNKLIQGKYNILQISIIGSNGRGYGHSNSDLDVTAIYALNKRQLCSLSKHPTHLSDRYGSVKALEVTHWMRQVTEYKPTALELLLHYNPGSDKGIDVTVTNVIWEYLDKKCVIDAFASMARGMMRHPKIVFKDIVRASFFYLLANFIYHNPTIRPPTNVNILLRIRGLNTHNAKFEQIFNLYREGKHITEDLTIVNEIWGCEDFVKDVFIPLCEELMIGKDYVTDNEQLVHYLEMYLRVYVYKIS